tara:strand:+ start:152 stop:313 length:162 start_codon:yes stop_codon:yes gene_type:complete
MVNKYKCAICVIHEAMDKKEKPKTLKPSQLFEKGLKKKIKKKVIKSKLSSRKY